MLRCRLQDGYLSPLSTFPTEVLDPPSEEDRARIAAAVPIIKVEAGLPASLDIRLERGATGAMVILLHKSKERMVPSRRCTFATQVRNKV
jgi:hypothetical protein